MRRHCEQVVHYPLDVYSRFGIFNFTFPFRSSRLNRYVWKTKCLGKLSAISESPITRRVKGGRAVKPERLVHEVVQD